MSRAAGALVVLAKEPRAGSVKTRLCPPLSPEQAAALQDCMLEDVLAASAGFARALDLEAWLAVHPPSACAALARRAPTPFSVVRQRGQDLAARMGQALREAAAAGHRKVLLRGSDCPLLDEVRLADALAALDAADLAVSPDADGGYNLLALRRPLPQVFDHPMSTGSVLEDTLARARELGLETRVLEGGFDIDTAADLARLHAARDAQGERLCPRTLAYLDREGLWGLARA